VQEAHRRCDICHRSYKRGSCCKIVVEAGITINRDEGSVLVMHFSRNRYRCPTEVATELAERAKSPVSNERDRLLEGICGESGRAKVAEWMDGR